MNYRTLGRTGLTVSEIGLGSEAFVKQTVEDGVALVNAAIGAGVNYFDLFNPEPHVRDVFGLAMQGRREEFIMQAHLCSAWIDGQYKRTRDMDQVKAAFTDKCMYCGHCAPCTAGIDIASVNKFADLCEAQHMVPETVREHYNVLSVKAGACVKCGQCEARCPFGVKIVEHMQKAVDIFGE